MSEMPPSNRLCVVDIDDISNDIFLHHKLVEKNIMWRVAQHVSDCKDNWLGPSGLHGTEDALGIVKRGRQRLLAENMKIEWPERGNNLGGRVNILIKCLCGKPQNITSACVSSNVQTQMASTPAFTRSASDRISVHEL